MVSESNLSINPDISQLLDEKFNVFTDEQKEKQRQDFIEELKVLVSNRRQLIRALAAACDVCLSQLNAEVREYYSFTRVYRPVAVIRNSVKGMLETDKSLYLARQALMETMAASTRGLDTVINGLFAVNEYRISSAEFHHSLEEHSKRIESGLTELEKRETGYRKAALSKTIDVPRRQLPESTVNKKTN